MITILIVVLIVIMLGGFGYRTYGPGAGSFGLLELIIVLIVIGLVLSLVMPLGRY